MDDASPSSPTKRTNYEKKKICSQICSKSTAIKCFIQTHDAKTPQSDFQSRCRRPRHNWADAEWGSSLFNYCNHVPRERERERRRVERRMWANLSASDETLEQSGLQYFQTFYHQSPLKGPPTSTREFFTCILEHCIDKGKKTKQKNKNNPKQPGRILLFFFFLEFGWFVPNSLRILTEQSISASDCFDGCWGF